MNREIASRYSQSSRSQSKQLVDVFVRTSKSVLHGSSYRTSPLTQGQRMRGQRFQKKQHIMHPDAEVRLERTGVPHKETAENREKS